VINARRPLFNWLFSLRAFSASSFLLPGLFPLNFRLLTIFFSRSPYLFGLLLATDLSVGPPSSRMNCLEFRLFGIEWEPLGWCLSIVCSETSSYLFRCTCADFPASASFPNLEISKISSQSATRSIGYSGQRGLLSLCFLFSSPTPVSTSPGLLLSQISRSHQSLSSFCPFQRSSLVDSPNLGHTRTLRALVAAFRGARRWGCQPLFNPLIYCSRCLPPRDSDRWIFADINGYGFFSNVRESVDAVPVLLGPPECHPRILHCSSLGDFFLFLADRNFQGTDIVLHTDLSKATSWGGTSGPRALSFLLSVHDWSLLILSTGGHGGLQRQLPVRGSRTYRWTLRSSKAASCPRSEKPVGSLLSSPL
jgi:hypothetical protein